MIFKKTTDVNAFFNILPEDWKKGILPFWEELKSTTSCYIISENDAIIGGGLVFSSCPPDMKYAENEANFWFEKGYLYLGFIFVLEEKRGQNLGSFWLENLIKIHPNQKYWLTIEDIKLHNFYTKNGFRKIKSILNEDVEEILYTFEN